MKKLTNLLFIISIPIFILNAIFAFSTYFFEFDLIENYAMDPIIPINSLVITKKNPDYKPKRFDIITYENNNSIYHGRIVGMPGELIFFENDQLYINNKPVDEPYINPFVSKFNDDTLTDYYKKYSDEISLVNSTLKYQEAFTTTPPTAYPEVISKFGYEVKNDEYFILGDNRPFSVDSRSHDAIKKSSIIGNNPKIIFPLNIKKNSIKSSFSFLK